MARVRASDLESVEALRAFDTLTDRGLRWFTLGTAPFLHFHALASGLVADVKVGDAWRRYDLADAAGHRHPGARRSASARRRADRPGRPADVTARSRRPLRSSCAAC